MNRENIYRGKRIDNGQWVYGYYVKLDEHMPGMPKMTFSNHIIAYQKKPSLEMIFHKVNPDTVGQYLWIFDKHGIGLYDDDLVITEQLNKTLDLDTWRRKEWGIARVFLDTNHGVCMKTKDDEWWAWEDDESVHSLEYIERIGNVHDYPEMWETTK